MTTPAIRAVRKNFPNAKISVLAKPWVEPIFYNNPDIDDIIRYDNSGNHKGLSGKFRLSRELKQKGFDLAVLLQNAIESALLVFFAGIPSRLGYNTDGRGFLLTHSISLTPADKKCHHIDYYLGMLKKACIEPDGKQLTLVVTDKEQEHAENILKSCGTSGQDNLIGINPSAAYGSAKRWCPKRYADLCVKLRKNCKVTIIIFGGPGDNALGKQISEATGKHCINICGKTSLREAVALIEKCALFITNDSGLMHAAAALDVPQIAIFGSTDHIATGPVNKKSHIIRADVPCSPCLKQECPTDHRCMKEITVDMVYETAKDILQSHFID